MTDVIPISDENGTIDTKWLKDQCNTAFEQVMKVEVMLTMLLSASDTNRRQLDPGEISNFCQTIKDTNDETAELIEQIEKRTPVLGSAS